MSAGHKILRFGAFQFDTRQQELSQRGLPIRMPASQIRLLTLLLERPQQLISRDDITQRLCTEPSSVDISSGINTAVNRLRGYLVDSSTNPIYIETVVGLGYRFIADVSVEDLDVAPTIDHPVDPIDSVPVVHAARPRRLWRLGAVAVTVSALALAGAGVWWHHSLTKTHPDSPMALQLTMVTLDDDDNKLTADAVSPDGKMTAYADSTGVLVHSQGSSPDQAVLTPSGLDVHRIDWSADGQKLYVSAEDSAFHQQLWFLSLNRQPPVLLLEDAEMATLSPDGRAIAFFRRSGHELWTSDVQGQQAHLLQSLNTADSFHFVVWSPNSKWLLTEQQHTGGAWLTQLIDPATGRLADQTTGARFDSASFLKNGDLLYADVPRQALEHPLLMSQPTDLSEGRFMGAPYTKAVFDALNVSGMSASAGGNHIAVLVSKGTSVVKVGKIHFPGPELTDVAQITHHSLDSFPHAWTPRDDAVLIENKNDPAASAIYEAAADGTRLTPIAHISADAAMGQFTPDGRWILFLGFKTAVARPFAVFRVSSTGGVPQPLDVPGNIREIRCPLSVSASCVIREILGTKAIVFYTLDPLKGLGKELGRIPWQPTVLGDWSLSPDGKTVAIAKHDPANPAIELVDFRSGHATVQEIPVSGVGVLLEATWASDGKALYVESRQQQKFNLWYLPLNGQAKLLRESQSPIWGVPSRDGSKLAFPDDRMTTNLWTGNLQP
jgi:DNA-binding winged helix-turn-helix (wHTH) protein/Tol biopolymer transport system component